MRRTLLLADDSVTIQKVVGITFANEDVELVTVDNGDEALSRAREIRPDLVLADVAMPGLSGYELCRSLRQDPELAGIPVLLLTGTFETFDERRAAEVGASGHIAKPFEAQALIDRVHALLAEAAGAPATPRTSGIPSSLRSPDPVEREPAAPSWAEPEALEDDAPAPHPLAIGAEESAPPPLEPAWAAAAEISDEDLRGEPPSERFLGATLSEEPRAPAPGLAASEPFEAEPVLGETTFPPTPEPPAAAEPSTSPDDSLPSDPEADLEFAEPEPMPTPQSLEPTRVHPRPETTPYATEQLDPEPARELGIDRSPAPGPSTPEQAALESLEDDDVEEEEPDLPWAEAFDEEPLGTPRGSDQELPGADALFEESLRFADDLEGSAPTLDPVVSAPRPAEEPSAPADSEPSPSIPEVWPESTERPAPAAAPPRTRTEEPTWYASAEPLDPEMLRQAIEKVAWEAFGSLSQEVVREVVRKVEEIAWEVIPQMAERLILEEIARLKTEPPPE